MDLAYGLNLALAILTILFGAIALVSPRYTMQALHLTPTGGRADGKAELRAASGGAFVATATAAILFGPTQPFAWVMLGVHYAGAGVGRITSIALDQAGSRKMWAFFAIEAAFAVALIALNWPI